MLSIVPRDSLFAPGPSTLVTNRRTDGITLNVDTIAITIIDVVIKSAITNSTIARLIHMIAGIGAIVDDGIDTAITTTRICITNCDMDIATRIAGTTGIGNMQ